MFGAFQLATSANIAPMTHGLPLEHLQALCGKEFKRVKRYDLTKQSPSLVEHYETRNYYESGKLFVAEYEVEFVRLSQYTVEMVSKKKGYCQRFFFGFHGDIQLYLVTHDVANFGELFDKAKVIRRLRNAYKDKRDCKCKMRPLLKCELVLVDEEEVEVVKQDKLIPKDVVVVPVVQEFYTSLWDQGFRNTKGHMWDTVLMRGKEGKQIKNWNNHQQEATAAPASSQRKAKSATQQEIDMFGLTHPEKEEEEQEIEEE
ncbi:hypothetical protein Golob_011559 [Gossypium lobatum]|uniref:Uncharacterized protein n=1 Tax=Gossypium lobatum TaxID=34289 RepID=A0A7J8MQ97_9ROSI|nr:hypothetical protein [Gossypium lobatum]